MFVEKAKTDAILYKNKSFKNFKYNKRKKPCNKRTAARCDDKFLFGEKQMLALYMQMKESITDRHTKVGKTGD
jgi:hypothetical protein